MKRNLPGRLRMAEVTSSSLVGSTLFFFGFAGKTLQSTERPVHLPLPLDDSLTTVGTVLREHVFHCTCGMVSHPGDHVGIGVERDRYGGVSEELLDVLGVHVASEQQRRAGVTQNRESVSVVARLSPGAA
jgi:hypothetical protein